MNTPKHVLRNRRNKLARGMTITISRSYHSERLSNEARTLSVKGTLDVLARRFMFPISRHRVCPCCGHRTGKLELSDQGKGALIRARRKHQQENATPAGA